MLELTSPELKILAKRSLNECKSSDPCWPARHDFKLTKDRPGPSPRGLHLSTQNVDPLLIISNFLIVTMMCPDSNIGVVF